MAKKTKRISFKVTVDVPVGWTAAELPSEFKSWIPVRFNPSVTRLAKPRTLHRSAITGKIVTKAAAKKRPRTTTKEKR